MNQDESDILTFLKTLDEKLMNEIIPMKNDMASIRQDFQNLVSSKSIDTNLDNLPVFQDTLKEKYKDWNHLKQYICFFCDKCSYKCDTGSDFETHLDENHNEEKQIECFEDDFDDILDEEYNIENETIDPLNHEKIVSECLQCNLPFDFVSELFDHIKSHHAMEDGLDTFICKKYFKTQCVFECGKLETFKHHIIKVHSNIEEEKKETTDQPDQDIKGIHFGNYLFPSRFESVK